MEILLDSDEGRLEFSLMLSRLIDNTKPVIVCVGSDRVVSDMIGPLTAELLVIEKVDAYIYGRLNNPITLRNLHSAFDYISRNHQGKQIIVIDAGVGKVCDVGKVRLNRGGIIPAGAFGGSSVMYGDVSIMPIVSVLGVDAKTFLCCAKFNEVYKTAKTLSQCIVRAIKMAEVINTKVV